MGRMIRKWTEWRTRVLSALMGVLGFGTLSMMNGCMEYGCPTRDFSYSGRVLTETGEPIEGVRVVLAEERWRQEPCDSAAENDTTSESGRVVYLEGVDTFWTDEEGQFRSDVYRGPEVYPMGTVLLDDVDGEANGGEFVSDTVRWSDMEEVKVKGGDGRWYEGEYEYTFEKRLREKEKSGE